jgi:predicted ATPase
MPESKYKETAHYTVTKQFLDSPERFLKHLFTEGDGDV